MNCDCSGCNDSPQCYHHLFAEFLRARLDERHPGRAQELHRRAARWFAAAGADPAAVSAVTAAVDHALAGQDCDFAARLLVEQAWPALTARAEAATILRWAPATGRKRWRKRGRWV